MEVAVRSRHLVRMSTLAGLCAFLAAITGCQRDTQIPAKSAAPVRLAEVTSYASAEGLRYSASIVPFAQASLSFKSSGYIANIRQVLGADGHRKNIGAGDYVPSGTVLAQIRQQDLRNQFDQAEAQVGEATAQHLQAEQDYERAKALYATQSLTRPDFDQVQARFDSTLAAVNQATAVLHQAQLALSDSDLKAPFSGFILARNIELGNLATPATTAFTIVDTSAVKVSFGVPDKVLRELHPGQELTIRLQDDPKDYHGKVTSISPNADERNRVFTIEVTVANHSGHLKPGMIASLSLGESSSTPAPSVPLSAIVPYPSQPGHFAVMVAQERSGKWTASLREVHLGETRESSIAVVGVQPGEKVIAVGAQLLTDGEPIELIP